MARRTRTRLFEIGSLAASIVLAASIAGASGCLAPDAVPSDASGGGGTGGSGTGGSGTGAAQAGDLLWAETFGDAVLDQRAWSVAATPDGSALIAGDFAGTLTMGALTAPVATDGRDGFAALLDPAGQPVWSAAFQGIGEQRVFRAVPLPDGSAIVVGSFEASLLIAGQEQSVNPQGRDGFVARLDADQKLKWIVRAEGPGNQAIHAAATAPGGDVIVAGTFQDALTLGDVTVAGDDDDPKGDFFVARISGDGAPLWATSIGGDPADIGPSAPLCFVAVAPNGTLRVAGTFSGTLQLDENLGAVGQRDAFIGALSSAGAPLWGHAIGADGGEQEVAALAVDAKGRALLAGDLRGNAMLSASTSLASEGDEPDAFLALYDGGGDLAWARRYGSVGQDHGGAAAFDAGGNILFAGRFRGGIHFGSSEEPLLNHDAIGGNDDIFLAKLTVNGAPLWSRAFGENDDQRPTCLAAAPSGDALLTGYFRGKIDFGAGEIDAVVGEDFFVARMSD